MAVNSDINVNLKAKDQQFSASIKKITRTLDGLGNEMNDLKNKFDKGEISLEAYEKEMKDLEKRSKTTRKALSSFGGEVKRTNNNLFRTRGGKRGKGSTSSNAGLAIQELGRGVADFNSAGGFRDINQGLRGATNNLERFAEIAVDLSRKGGGLKNVFKQLGKSLLGTGGLILGITLLLQFLPQIIKFFKGLGSESSKLKGELKKLNTELTDLRKDYFGDGKSSVEDQIIAKWDEIIKKQGEYIKELDNAATKNPATLQNANLINTGGARTGGVTLADKQFAALQQNINKFGKNRDEEAIKEKKDIAAANALYKTQSGEITRKLALAKASGVEGDDLLRLERKLLNTLELENVALETQIAHKHRLAILNKTLNFGDTPQVQSVNAGLTPAGVDTSGFPTIGGGNFDDLIQSEKIKEADRGYDEYLAKMSEVEAKNKLVTDSFKTLGRNISQSLTQSHGIAGAFFGTMIEGLLNLAAQQITSAAITSTTEAAKQGAYGATATAAAVAGAAEGAAAGGPAAPVLLPIFIAAALAAIGAALSGTGGSRGSGGRGRSSGSARASVTPTSIQGGGGNRNGGAIGVIRGNQIRYINQVEADSYSGRN